MKKQTCKRSISLERHSEESSDRLFLFFDLLMRIDQRNHPELYEHNQSGTSPNQTAKGSDGICLCGD
ncbi:MAG TPA: hypothetical protein VGJ00_01595 [Rhabdochlamydiaceae bacterium]